MNAQELRIGNLVRRVGLEEIRRVVEITTLTVTHTHVAIPDDEIGLYDDSQVEGIPLTAEWLERFGFVMVKELDWYAWKKQHGYKFFRVVLQEKNVCAVNLEFLNNDIQAVHQLQNWWFANTSGELTLTPMTDRVNKIAIVGHPGPATMTEIQLLRERGFEVELVTSEQAKNLHLSSERIKPIQIESIDLPKLVMKSGRENRRERRKQERKNRKR